MKNVTIIVPCYNEEEMLPLFLKKAEELFIDNDKYSFDFIYVDDGSKDKTLEILREASLKSERISYISLSKNCGQDPALSAGLKKATGDCAIMIDCDMQDPPELIFQLLEKYEEGYDVVNPQRSKRETDTYFKKTSSGIFYRFVNKMAKKEVVPPNVSMYRLLSRKALDYLNSLPESDRIIRSEVPFIGLKTCYIKFERQQREAGKTKYNFHRMFDLGERTLVDSTTGLLTMVLKIGLLFSFVGFLGMLGCIIAYIIINANLDIGTGLTYFHLIFALIIFVGILIVGVLSIVVYIPCMYLKVIHINTQNRPTYLIGEQFDSVRSIAHGKKSDKK